MKLIKYSLSMLLCSVVLAGCNDLADNDYFSKTEVSNTNSEVLSSTLTVIDYLHQRTDFSQMSDLFEKEGIYETMPTSGELHTVLVVTNDHFKAPEADESAKVAKSHVTNISVSPSKLNNGDRLLMWHDKYVTITSDDEALTGNLIGHVFFNQSPLQEVIKCADGFVYVIADMIETPTSLQDYINGLDDDHYSIFKDMVLSSGGKVFDRANSKVIGVDPYGNTLYDSVFIYTNTFFDAKNYDLSSEALKATVLVFSDEVINKALKEATDRLESWGYNHKIELLRNGSLDSVYVGYTSFEDLKDWILQVAFFRQTYSADDIRSMAREEDPAKQDMKSIYDRKWRTSVQKLDLDNPVALSNGVAYEVVDFRIPNNRLIYRLHEEFNIYEQCDADQKAMYFKATNLTNFKINSNEVAPWTPLSGVWPMHGNSPLACKVADNTQAHFGMDYTPIFSRPNENGGYDIRELLVPPGTYRMAMGFKQGLNLDLTIELFAMDDDKPVSCGDPYTITIDAQTIYHYDRGAQLSGALPEKYDKNDPNLTAGSKNPYYWTDGGPVFQEITVPDIYEDGRAQHLMIRMTSENGTTAGNVIFNHWCLRPTDNNY